MSRPLVASRRRSPQPGFTGACRVAFSFGNVTVEKVLALAVISNIAVEVVGARHLVVSGQSMIDATIRPAQHSGVCVVDAGMDYGAEHGEQILKDIERGRQLFVDAMPGAGAIASIANGFGSAIAMRLIGEREQLSRNDVEACQREVTELMTAAYEAAAEPSLFAILYGVGRRA